MQDEEYSEPANKSKCEYRKYKILNVSNRNYKILQKQASTYKFVIKESCSFDDIGYEGLDVF